MGLPEHVWTFIRDIHAPPPPCSHAAKMWGGPVSTWPQSPVGEFTYAQGSGLGRGEQRQTSRAALRAKDKAYRAAQAWVLNRFEWAHLPGVAEELVDDENPPLAPQVECHRQAVQLKGHQHEHERLQPSHLQVRSSSAILAAHLQTRVEARSQAVAGWWSHATTPLRWRGPS